jgi:hypothetical protein
MKILAIALLSVILMPVTLHACDCGCQCGTPPFHFKDGIAPNGPSNTEAIYADSAHYPCGTYAFRDYGPAHVVTQPAPEPKEMVRPSS